MTNYSVVSEKQQVKMSRTLSELMSGNVHKLEKTSSSQVGECSTDPSASSAGRSAADHHQQASSCRFSRALLFMEVNSAFLLTASINSRSWQSKKLR